MRGEEERNRYKHIKATIPTESAKEAILELTAIVNNSVASRITDTPTGSLSNWVRHKVCPYTHLNRYRIQRGIIMMAYPEPDKYPNVKLPVQEEYEFICRHFSGGWGDSRDLLGPVYTSLLHKGIVRPNLKKKRWDKSVRITDNGRLGLLFYWGRKWLRIMVHRPLLSASELTKLDDILKG